MIAGPAAAEVRSVHTPTIDDVARVARVSASTVWRLLKGSEQVSPATRNAILRAIALLRYTPASPLSCGVAPPMRVGLIRTSQSAAYLNSFLVSSLRQVAASTMQVVIEQCETAERPTVAARRLAQRGIDGIVLPPPLCYMGELLDMVAQEGFPAVLMGNSRASVSASILSIDDFEAAHDMTAHLLDLGHSRIGFIMGALERPASRRQYDGYCAALGERSLAVDEKLIERGASTYRSGLDAAEILLDIDSPPTAIFATDDATAAATISVANRRGLDVPSDLTVCGFGDSLVAMTIWPNITTVCSPIMQMGQIATELIAAAILAQREGQPPPAARVILHHQLIRRQSDGPPRRRPRSSVKG